MAQTNATNVGPRQGRHLARWADRAYGVVFLAGRRRCSSACPSRPSRSASPTSSWSRSRPTASAASCRSASDVKIRGLIVGEVRRIATTGDGARLAAGAPARRWSARSRPNVSARLLPKTLFGERYVDLVTPAGAGRRADPAPATIIRAGPQPAWRSSSRRSSTTCCRCCARCSRRSWRPRSTPWPRTLDGRGDQARPEPRARRPLLHGAQPAACRPSRRTSPAWPTWPARMPWRRRTWSARPTALVTTNKTIVREAGRRSKGFFAGTAGFANDDGGLPAAATATGSSRRAASSRPSLAVLREVRARVPLHGHGAGQLGARHRRRPAKNDTFHITLEVGQQRDGYQPGEEPAWGEKRGPHCYGLPDSRAGTRRNPRPGTTTSTTAPRAGGNGASSALPSAFLGALGCRHRRRRLRPRRDGGGAEGGRSAARRPTAAEPSAHHDPARRADAARSGGEPAMKTSSQPRQAHPLRPDHPARHGHARGDHRQRPARRQGHLQGRLQGRHRRRRPARRSGSRVSGSARSRRSPSHRDRTNALVEFTRRQDERAHRRAPWRRSSTATSSASATSR